MNRAICEQIEGRRAEIRRVCQRCHVRLELLGSATLDRFDPKRSDLDFPVGFQDGFTTLDNYLALAECLEDLFERPVDLAIATHHLVYDDRGEEVAAVVA